MKKFYTLLAAAFLWPVVSFAQNAETCDDATVISEGSHDVDTLMGAGGSQAGAYSAAWYSYTPSDAGTITVSSCYGGSDTRLFIHDGTCASPNLIANNDDECPFMADSSGSTYASEVSDLSVVGGTTYLIEWDGRWSTDPFTFNVTFEPLPGPDSCDIAAVVEPGLQYTDTLEGGLGTQGYSAAFYTFTPAEDGFMNVTSCYGGSDTRLWIWEGTCDALVAVDNTDDDCIFATDSTGFSYAAALYSVAVTGGTTYYIEWDARWSSDPFWWNLEYAADGEACFTSAEVMVPSATTTDSITGNGDGGSQGYAASWYHFTPTEDMSINIESCYGGSDTRLYLWEGDCDNLALVASDDDSCPFMSDSTGSSYASQLTGIDVTGGTTYWVEWDARWSSNGFDWNITIAPEVTSFPTNDTCQGATPVVAPVGTTTTVMGNAENATPDDTTWTLAQVWESFTLEECADVTLNFCGSADSPTSAYTALFSACPVDTVYQFGAISLTDCPDSSTTNLLVEFTELEAGTYYYPVVADAAAGAFLGDYTMAITPTACAVDPPVVEGESFESGIFPPECWTQSDEDGDGQSWFAYGADPYAGDSSAATASWNGSPLTPDNWLITPQLELGTGEELRFYVAGQDPNWSAENYSIYISTTGNEVADFTTELWTETLASPDWLERTLDLSDYDGQTVYLAFRHHDVTDQFVMKIDNVVLPGTELDCAVSVEELSKNSVNLNVYPNPNNGQFSLLNEGLAGDFLIEMMDVTGKVVHTERVQLNNAQRTDINTRNVTPGVYLLKMTNTEENYYRTLRMVVK